MNESSNSQVAAEKARDTHRKSAAIGPPADLTKLRPYRDDE